MHVTANSQEVKKGSIFFALQGAKFDGHNFIQAAMDQGAVEIYCERDVGIASTAKCKILVIGDQARKKLGEFASEMAGNPTHALKMIGVTGTSGKTTTTYLIHHLLESCGHACARLGTNGGYFRGQEIETANTTPDALTLQQWFHEVKNLGAEYVVMEVSSHALHQDRVWGIAWDAATFLNLSPEHLDYHATLDEYFEAKALLFTTHAHYSKKIGKKPYFSTNVENEYGARLRRESVAEKFPVTIQGYSVQSQIRNLQNTATGIQAEIFSEGQWIAMTCPLFGTFQIENILAALSVVVGLGIDARRAIAALANFSGVPGRMESIANQKGIFVFVDYAHKPEALEKVLLAIQGKKIISVVGCGGDRDKTKRPVMGEIATRLSDYVFFTSDNPRTEDPLQILREIEAGVPKKNYRVVPDRAEAIRLAIAEAKSGDVVLIAGKGHEDYQIFGTEKKHFDDREEARQALTLG
jgi:UDP-N-acetylmuramoyl-L-alanyl-D-glutamate--2,6-diaminopimelate ligase